MPLLKESALPMDELSVQASLVQVQKQILGTASGALRPEAEHNPELPRSYPTSVSMSYHFLIECNIICKKTH